MRAKRLRHDTTVIRYKANEYTDENVSLFKQNMYSIQNDVFKRDENEKENNSAGEMDDYSDDEAKVTMNGNSSMAFDDQEFSVTVTGNDEEQNQGEKSGKRKKDGISKKVLKRQKVADIIDKEHFIPYKPKNFQTEKG